VTNFIVSFFSMQAHFCTAPKEPLDDTPNKSSVEVEQILPCRHGIVDFLIEFVQSAEI
jgi:hypothetical protein